ncbi:ScyD/ScyE family protein [Kribbella sp.]|uniref:ScyD/ScyE family protein n=1 Tax=Kribbella sp. TaxID=1871183 RepID=UPI002D37FE76|nr:ScyD/ScyE family protein [Kribbella sp.]HZX01661.1 ScyD/ScyE family protein [Kribbella sp.]
MGVRTRIAALAAVALAGSVLVAGQADAGDSHHASLKPVATGLNGPRGVSTYRDKVIYSVSDGSVYATDGRRTWKLGTVPGSGGLAPAVDTNRWGTTYALTGAGAQEGAPPAPGSLTLYRMRLGKAPVVVADIGAYQKKDPDPYDLENNPTDSNPFGVAALRDGTVLVSDAAGNDLLRVWPNGHIATVARLKPRTVKVPAGLGNQAPPPGTPIPSEAVATSVTVGSDGYWYVGELRGFPATPGTSQIWRIKPGSVGAVCDPVNPSKGNCKRYADGYTSIVGLAGGPHGTLAVVELAKASWLAFESGGSTVGGLFLQYPGRHHTAGYKRELVPGQLHLPGGATFNRWGRLFVAGPVFGPGAVYQVR